MRKMRGWLTSRHGSWTRSLNDVVQLLNLHMIIGLPVTRCLGTKYLNLKAKNIRADLLIFLPNLNNPVWY